MHRSLLSISGVTMEREIEITLLNDVTHYTVQAHRILLMFLVHLGRRDESPIDQENYYKMVNFKDPYSISAS